jgi:hypothetical protein
MKDRIECPPGPVRYYCCCSPDSSPYALRVHHLPAGAGTVLDQDAALGGGQVTPKGGEPDCSLSLTTGACGAFRFEKLSAGDYEILITREGVKPTTARVTIGNHPPAPLRIVLPVADLRLSN